MQKHMIQTLVIKVCDYSGENGTYWCYFDQIEDNLTEKEKSDVDVQINLDNEWWK